MPWVFTRAKIAERWHVPPWVVDEAPTDEVLTALKLIEIETESRPKHG